MNAPPPLPAPPPPLRPNAWRAVGGIWRLTWRRYASGGQVATLAVLTGLLLLLTYAIVDPRRGSEFYNWVISFYLMAIVPVIAFVAGGGTIRDDMKAATVDYLLTRPVRRPVLVLARYVSQLVCLQLIHLAVLGGLMGVGVLRQISDLGAAFPTLATAQAVTITAFLAMGYLCGSLTSRYLILGILYAGTVEMGLGSIPIQLSKLSVLRHIKGLLVEQFPFAFTLEVVPQGAVETVAMMTVFVLVWLAVATLVFSVQEFAGQRPKDA